MRFGETVPMLLFALMLIRGNGTDRLAPAPGSPTPGINRLPGLPLTCLLAVDGDELPIFPTTRFTVSFAEVLPLLYPLESTRCRPELLLLLVRNAVSGGSPSPSPMPVLLRGSNHPNVAPRRLPSAETTEAEEAEEEFIDCGGRAALPCEPALSRLYVRARPARMSFIMVLLPSACALLLLSARPLPSPAIRDIIRARNGDIGGVCEGA